MFERQKFMALLYHANGPYDENTVDILCSANQGIYTRADIEAFVGKKIVCIDIGFNTVIIFSETARCSFNSVATQRLYINTNDSDYAIYGEAVLLDYAEMDHTLHHLIGEEI